jgi:hypothetical protein
MMIQKGDAKGKQKKAERKTQRSTSEKLFNGAHRRAEALVEIQFLTLFSIFNIFLILYH